MLSPFMVSIPCGNMQQGYSCKMGEFRETSHAKKTNNKTEDASAAGQKQVSSERHLFPQYKMQPNVL